MVRGANDAVAASGCAGEEKKCLTVTETAAITRTAASASTSQERPLAPRSAPPVLVGVVRGRWWSLGWPVSVDDVGAVGAVGDDLGDGVAGVAEVGADLVVQGGGVGEVEGDEGEVVAGDVVGEGGGVAVAGDAGGFGGVGGAGAGGQDDVAGG